MQIQAVSDRAESAPTLDTVEYEYASDRYESDRYCLGMFHKEMARGILKMQQDETHSEHGEQQRGRVSAPQCETPPHVPRMQSLSKWKV